MDELVAYYPWLALGGAPPAPRPPRRRPRPRTRRAPRRESGYRQGEPLRA
jgi:hypothetical protein